MRIIELIKSLSGFNQEARFFFTIGEDKEKRYYIEKLTEVGGDLINVTLKKYE